jgi:hypothetical protein
MITLMVITSKWLPHGVVAGKITWVREFLDHGIVLKLNVRLNIRKKVF